MEVAFYFAGEITQVLDAIPWVRCASGNVRFHGSCCMDDSCVCKALAMIMMCRSLKAELSNEIE